MKRYRLFLPIFLCLCFACTQFDEEAMLDEAPTTRAAVNAAALRESAGIANADNPYSVDNMKAAMTQYCKVMNSQSMPRTNTSVSRFGTAWITTFSKTVWNWRCLPIRWTVC